MYKLITILIYMFLGLAGLAQSQEWQKADQVRPMVFPRDHFSHPAYKTEWWYFTGNLRSDKDELIGFQFTLFRQGVRPPGSSEVESLWIPDHIGFGHAAISKPSSGEFVFGQVLERGSLGSVEFPPAEMQLGGEKSLLARVGDWHVTLNPDATFSFSASIPEGKIDLTAKPIVPTVLQGKDGLSQKAEGVGNASHYFSIPRLETKGTLTVLGETHNVSGLSWLDREWASNQLAPDQIGWDWFAIQLEDGRDLMLYQMRRRDGTRDAFNHGSLRQVDGTVVHLAASDFTLTPRRLWKSPDTGASYPVEWNVKLPGHGLEFEVKTVQDRQELNLAPVSYYEGAISVKSADGLIKGQGYLEMTGYGKPLEALRSR